MTAAVLLVSLSPFKLTKPISAWKDTALRKHYGLNDWIRPYAPGTPPLWTLSPWIASVWPVSHSLCRVAQCEGSSYRTQYVAVFAGVSVGWSFIWNSLSLRDVWLSPPAQDHLCWRISAHVFFVDLLIADSYLSWRGHKRSQVGLEVIE